MVSSPELALYGIFQSLLARHVPLGVRDYLDAIRALRAGFGIPPEGSGGPLQGRERLLWLTKSLWARSDDERRLIEGLFAAIPLPTPEEISNLERCLESEAKRQTKSDATDAQQGQGSKTDSPLPLDASRRTTTNGPTTAVEFQSKRDAGGLPLPSLIVKKELLAETYVMQLQTVVNARTLVTLWRRFRAYTRTGAKTEFDPEGTVAERCRKGVLVHPIFRAPRSNRARLLILADVSTSMTPWLPFLQTVSASLPLSCLNAVSLYHFANVPRRLLYASIDLTKMKTINEVFTSFLGASLLIISDAGAARGHLSQRRFRDTNAFVERARKELAPRAMVWLNPMPCERWTNTTAALVANRCRATFLPLDGPSLIKAIDVLRGSRMA